MKMKPLFHYFETGDLPVYSLGWQPTQCRQLNPWLWSPGHTGRLGPWIQGELACAYLRLS